MSVSKLMENKTKRFQAITDLIESIALEEAGLADILSAEGELLQKLCFEKLSLDDFLAENKSIEDLIKAIVELEEEFHEKLELFKDCLCDDEDDEHKRGNSGNASRPKDNRENTRG